MRALDVDDRHWIPANERLKLASLAATWQRSGGCGLTGHPLCGAFAGHRRTRRPRIGSKVITGGDVRPWSMGPARAKLWGAGRVEPYTCRCGGGSRAPDEA